MKERPILFSAPMVHAILEGRKTQTRRMVKGQEFWGEFSRSARPIDSGMWRVEGCEPINEDLQGNKVTFVDVRCPYGQPGDRLWVRETWQYYDWTEDGMPWIRYCADGKTIIRSANVPDEWSEKISGIWESLSDPANYDIDQRAADRRWRPSIHMPRWASRITLEITGVRVERLNDISEQDAIAEGLKAITKDGSLVKYGIPDRDGLPGADDDGWPWKKWCTDPRGAFFGLWESINGAGSWRQNPLVWVVEFKRVHP
jgi:hypothetical protein